MQTVIDLHSDIQ